MRRTAVAVVVVAVVAALIWIVTGRGAVANTADDGGSAGTGTSTSSAGLTGELFSVPSTGSEPSEAADSGSPSESATPTSDAASVDPSVAEAESAAQAAAASDAAVAQSAAEAAAAQSAADAAAAQAAADAAAAEQARVAAEAEAARVAAESAAAASLAARQTDDQGRLLCADGSVQLTATVGAPTYRSGQQPILGVTVTNISGEACVRDVSGSLQEFLAYDAAGNRIWSTADCAPGEGSEVRLLQPGESLQYNIKWSGRTSSPGGCAARTVAPPGEYRIEVRMGPLVSSQAALTLT